MTAVADIEAKLGVATVFVVAPRRMIAEARDVAHRLAELGPFDVVLDIDITTDGKLKDVSGELWAALAKSDAVVFVLDDSDLTSEGYVELGAAWAREIPTLALSVVAQPRVPVMLSRQPCFHEGALAELVREIHKSTEPMSPAEIEAMSKLYSRHGVPVDKLITVPGMASKFASELKKITGRSVLEQRVLTQLLRLRKSGKLPRVTSSSSDN